MPGSAKGCRNVARRKGWPVKKVPAKGGKNGEKEVWQPPLSVLAAIAKLGDGSSTEDYATTSCGSALLASDSSATHLTDKSSWAPIPPRPPALEPEKPVALSSDFAFPSESFIRVPFYDVRASAGHGAFVGDHVPTRHYAFDREWLALHVGVPASRLALIPVAGNSMEPDLHDGDLVMIDRGDIEVLREGVYVFELEDRLYVKRLSLRGERLVVASSNGDYPPDELNLLQENPGFRLHGRVLGSPSFKRL